MPKPWKKTNDDTESTETVYHGGFLYIYRLDKLFLGLDQVTFERDSENDKLHNMKRNFFLLKALFKELHSKMEDKDKDHQVATAEIITIQYKSCLKTFKLRGNFTDDIFDLFDEWELDLRQITADKGLLMPDKEEETGL